jgi:hypothetical protein
MLSLLSCVLLLRVVSCSSSVVNVKLVPSNNPFPQVVAEIARLEAVRGDAEDVSVRALEAAYGTALKAARSRIDSVVASYVASLRKTHTQDAAAFLSRSDIGSSSFALRIAPVAPPSVNIRKQIDLMEQVRGSEEALMTEQGSREFSALADIVVNELCVTLLGAISKPGVHGATAFITESVGQVAALDVRLLPPTAQFTTVERLVQDMEVRRTSSEDGMRTRILELQLKFMKALNAMVGDALRARAASS